MHPTLYFLGAAALLLLLAMLSIWVWDKFARPPRNTPGDGIPEGAFRGFYHALWILIVWSSFALFVPLWLSFRAKVTGLDPAAKIWMVAKTLSILVVLLLVLFYGRRRGYLSWIDGLQWPDKENK